MRAVLAVAAASIIAAAVGAMAFTSQWRPASPPEPVADSVVRLTIDTGLLRPELATGWAGPCGLVVTAAHALDRARGITVTDAIGRTGTATIVAVERRPDLALLRVTGLRLPELRLHERPQPDRGWAVVPRGGRPHALDTGVAPVRVNIRDYTGEHQRAGLELDRSLLNGDSGAPVVTAEGDVLGVVFASADARAYATAANEVAALVERARPSCTPDR